jgi:glutamate-1-semialdehyde 2,1-aminomutase
VFFRESPPANFSEAKESDREAFGRFFHHMRGAGVLLPPSQFEAWFVSAAHDDAAIESTLAAASRAD